MKNCFLILLTNLFIINICFAQSKDKNNDHRASLNELWFYGKTDKAITLTLKLYQQNRSFFLYRIHDDLALQLEKDRKHHRLKYLEQLYSKGHMEINEIITPIYLWAKALNTKNKKELISIQEELNNFQKHCLNYDSKSVRYSLLILKILDEAHIIDNNRSEIIFRNIQYLTHKSNQLTDNIDAEKLSRCRYMLAYCYDYLYSNVIDKEEYLKKASDYSPNYNDRLNRMAYFNDAKLLTKDIHEIGYKTKYHKYLVAKNRRKEALELLCEITSIHPSDTNISSLRKYYEKTKHDGLFYSYWEEFIENQGMNVPNVILKFKNEELDLSKSSDKWIYIDVWGTWCSPCCEELPELQSFYSENKNNNDSKLKIYTFSYKSRNLTDFMSKNNYTFPVSEIDKQTNDLFGISGYPTKILISPQGNYIKLPAGDVWKIFLKNYLLQ